MRQGNGKRDKLKIGHGRKSQSRRKAKASSQRTAAVPVKRDKPKFIPLRHYLGHYCPNCQWWRYGMYIPFWESEHIHIRRCKEPLKVTGKTCTGRDMQRKLEAEIHG